MNMTDYLLTTSVTAEALSPVFEEAVRVTCCKDYTPSQVEAWVQRATSSRWRELLSGDLHFLAAVSQPSGEVAGFISVRGDGYLHSLFVHPAHQRRGVASFLLRAAEEEARRSEAPDLFSEVSLTAKPFFLSQGFSVEQEQTMRVNGVELTNFRMRKPLILSRRLRHRPIHWMSASIRLHKCHAFPRASVRLRLPDGFRPVHR